VSFFLGGGTFQDLLFPGSLAVVVVVVIVVFLFYVNPQRNDTQKL